MVYAMTPKEVRHAVIAALTASTTTAIVITGLGLWGVEAGKDDWRLLLAYWWVLLMAPLALSAMLAVTAGVILFSAHAERDALARSVRWATKTAEVLTYASLMILALFFLGLGFLFMFIYMG